MMNLMYRSPNIAGLVVLGMPRPSTALILSYLRGCPGHARRSESRAHDARQDIAAPGLDHMSRAVQVRERHAKARECLDELDLRAAA